MNFQNLYSSFSGHILQLNFFPSSNSSNSSNSSIDSYNIVVMAVLLVLVYIVLHCIMVFEESRLPSNEDLFIYLNLDKYLQPEEECRISIHRHRESNSIVKLFKKLCKQQHG